MKITSVTDLKAHLSERLRQVQAGESLVVTDRNQPVALLQPLPKQEGDERLTALTAAGVVSPAAGRLDVDAFLKMPSGHCAASVSQAIIEERSER